uniref:Uncharacterized protein n=1 Tax=Parascaris univalens TaxID=6257 RepID=A0A915BP88_PARUN
MRRSQSAQQIFHRNFVSITSGHLIFQGNMERRMLVSTLRTVFSFLLKKKKRQRNTNELGTSPHHRLLNIQTYKVEVELTHNLTKKKALLLLKNQMHGYN